MQTRRVGRLDIAVPDLDPRELDQVTEPPDGDLVGVLAGNSSWAGNRLYETRIGNSQASGVDATEAMWERVTLSGSVFDGVDLSHAEFSDVVIECCVLRDCRLTGAHFIGAVFTNVIFEGCRFDFATLRDVAGSGPVALVDCNLVNANFTSSRLPQLVLRDCKLDRLELQACDLRGADLRGNGLTGIVGELTSLRGVTLSRDQLPDLATMVVHDLNLTVAEDAR
ncbi:pentapeptide repeat-containing protein [Micromonospora sp. NPDC050397]|uniref:pentapeptide repeat-containing protein n=1 Tax=Micromonospora sp. NPDC050397 TaxID=3364279 RepID=UPI003850334C